MASSTEESRFVRWLRKIAEASGIDWFSRTARRSALDSAAQGLTYGFSEAAEGIPEEALKIATERSSQYLAQQTEQVQRIESKAITLLGTTGITTAFIVGFAGFLASWGAVASLAMTCVLSVAFALVVLALLMTILLASQAVGVATHRRLDAGHILNLSKESPGTVSRQLVVDQLSSAAFEKRIANRKGTYLMGAQTWFRNALVLILILACLLAVFLPISRLLGGGSSTVSAETTDEVPAINPSG